MYRTLLLKNIYDLNIDLIIITISYNILSLIISETNI